MKKPTTIYLQWYGEGGPNDGEVFPSKGDVTWCHDKIFDHDIEFVAAPTVPDEVVELLKRSYALIDAMMPGVKHIALQNYSELNDVPVAIRAALAKHWEGEG